MLVVGLTGGIGSGKSTLAALLADRGAHVIDADALGRAALEPGEPAWHSVVGQFGGDIMIAGEMQIDRERLGEIVFSDPGKLASLNAIVHPVIFGHVADELDRLRATDAIVVLDAALIVELGLRSAVDTLVAVVAPEDVREQRLVSRGLPADQARARMAAQSDPRSISEQADIVVDNSNGRDALAAAADRLWAEFTARLR